MKTPFHKFEIEIEKEFRLQYLDTSLMRTGIVLAFILMAFYSVMDLYMLPETRLTALTIRLLVLIPVVAILIFSLFPVFRNNYAPFVMATLLIVSFGIILMIYNSKKNEFGYYYYFAGLMIVISYIGLFSELRFKQAFIVIFFIICGYMFVAVYFQHMLVGFQANKDFPIFLMSTVSLTASGVLSLFASILVERYRRTSFWQRKEIELEKAKSENLLQNILPLEVATELKETGSTKAKNFDRVTVLFTDFINFTAIAEKLDAKELVSEINHYYTSFDNIICKYGIEKIKTIGDSYMCAGGLTGGNKLSVENTLNAAIEIREFMFSEKQKRTLAGKIFFEVRIGIHSGPVIAGIVGTKKFAYDIWGDTVNIASRMETSGEAGKINISGSTYELVKDKFNCNYRGKIQTKNKGEIDMYFVEAISLNMNDSSS